MSLAVLDARRRSAPLVGAAVVLVGAGALVPVSPLAAFALVGAVAYGALIVLRPKAFVAMAILVSLFATTAEQLTGVHGLKFVDDAVVITAVGVLLPARVVGGRMPRLLPGLWWFVAFAAIGLLSDLANHVPLRISAEGGYLALKGVAFGFAVAQVDWSLDDARRAARLAAGTLLFVLACCVVNLLAPGAWTSRVLVASLNGGYRLGIQSLVGPFIHPGSLGQVAALSAIAVFAYRQTHGASTKTTMLGLAAAAATALTFRRKAITGMLAGGLVVGLRRRPGQTVFVLALTAPLVIALSWSQIATVVDHTRSEYLGQDQSQVARTVLYSNSQHVARNYFPLGAGFGRYGTHTAIAHYSPLYWQLGFDHVYGLEPGGGNNGDFASDTFWPGVLGETGLFGFVAFAGGLVALWRRFARYGVSEVPILAWLGLVGLGWSVEYLMESFAAADYVGPPVYPLLFALAGFACAVSESARGGDLTPTSA